MTSYLLSVIFSYTFLSTHDDIKEDDETECKLLNFQNYQSLFPGMKCSLMSCAQSLRKTHVLSWMSLYSHTPQKWEGICLVFPSVGFSAWNTV